MTSAHPEFLTPERHRRHAKPAASLIPTAPGGVVDGTHPAATAGWPR